MKDINVNIESVSKDAAEALSRRNHAFGGTVLLTSSSTYTTTNGQSPIGNYIGFQVGGSGCTINEIIFYDKTMHATSGSETINDLVFNGGEYIPLYGIKQITLSAGSILLFKK